MRLLNVHDLSLRTFQPANLPKYAVTSHRWGDDEASIQDIRSGLDLSKSGHRKVKGFADYVRDRTDGIYWIWIDTCCINQDSSQEVSEAINTMFKWYRNAEVCLAYLADVAGTALNEHLEESVWFTRGWTLQELVAPSLVVYLSQDWSVIGRTGGDSKTYHNSGVRLYAGPSLASSISAITQIPIRVVIDYSEAWDIGVQDRLRWAAGRQSTKEEDMVYCLLGICGVTMPVVYGEGYQKARKRLLRELEIEGHDFDEKHALPSDHRVSVPYSIVPTYTERTEISKELHRRLQQARVDQALGRVLGIVGDEGSGKKQLVLRYIETHREDYDTILWFDISSWCAAIASFERFCRDFSLPVKALRGGEEITDMKDAPAVRALFSWLRSRPRHEKWLAILEGADSLVLDVGSTVPRSEAGTVITINRNAAAARMLLGNSSVLRVSAMSTSEGLQLLRKFIDADDEQYSKMHRLAVRVVDSLSCLPFAIELYGIRIRAEASDCDEVVRFMGKCLLDEAERQDLSSQQDYNRDHQDQANMSFSLLSLRLFRLLALFNYQGIPNYLFTLATIRLGMVARKLFIDIPNWLRQVFGVAVDGTWNSTCYWDAVAPLLRCGLVERTTGRWPGVRIHESLQMPYKRENVPDSDWELFFLLIVSAICQINVYGSDHPFGSHLLAHLPSMTDVLRWNHAGREEMAWACVMISTSYGHNFRLQESQPFLEEACKTYRSCRGQEHQKTLGAEDRLAQAYEVQHMWTQSEVLRRKRIAVSARIHGEQHSDTLIAKGWLARTYRGQGRLAEAEILASNALDAMKVTLTRGDLLTMRMMCELSKNYEAQGRLKDANCMYSEVVESHRKTREDAHPETIRLQSRFNQKLARQGRWEEAIASQEQAVKVAQECHGLEDPTTKYAVDTAERLLQGRQSAAREAAVEQNTHSVLPASLSDKAVLEGTRGSSTEDDPSISSSPPAAAEDESPVLSSAVEGAKDELRASRATAWSKVLKAKLHIRSRSKTLAP